MQVDIALECARMQHRFSLPPLQVEDFPQVGLTDFKMMQSTNSMSEPTNHQTDILQEILSVAHVSQELIHQTNLPDAWGGNYAAAAADNDFTFIAGKDPHPNVFDNMNSATCIDKPWMDPNTSRSVDIGDLDEPFKIQKSTENLRWVGMSNEELEKVQLLMLHLK